MRNVIFIFVMIAAAFLGGAIFLHKGGVLERFSTEKVIDTEPSGKVQSEINYIPEGWQTYESPEFDFSISFPPEFETQENSLNSIMILKKETSSVVGPANFIYVSIIPESEKENEGEIYNYNPDQLQTLMELETGESASLSEIDNTELNVWFTYTRLPDTIILGNTAKVYFNQKPWEFPAGTSEIKTIITNDSTIYIIGGYYNGDSVENPIIKEEVESIISTFKTY